MPRIAIAALSLVLVPSVGLAGGGGDWITFTDETATRLVADPAVGTMDEEEKDFAVADLDRDGDPDVVVVRKVPFSSPGGKRNVLFMNENGVMTDRTATLAIDFLDTTDDRDIALADLNGDGWIDAVTVTTFGEQPRVYMNLGEVDGIWQGLDWDAKDARIPEFTPQTPKFCSVGVGDVTGDQRPELFFVDYDNGLEDRLLINDGNGFFTDETDTRLTALMSDSVFGTDAAILDIDGDGDNDIIKNNASGMFPPPGSQAPAVIVLYNSGSGSFDFRQVAYDDAPYMFEPGDFNNDGRIDLFVVDDLQDSFLLNQGNDMNGRVIWSELPVTQSPKTEDFGGNTVVADFDLDGFLDVYVTDVDTDAPGCDRTSVALQNQGNTPNISLIDPLNGGSRSWMPSGTYDVAILDIDGNGNLDIWAGTCDGHSIFMSPTLLIFEDNFEGGTTAGWDATVGQ